ncbi:MAG: hypothetical protein K2X43_06005 [Hyphomonadaceae bacterium]|nr:hypothetical protein [Hyphomonadaceae bacterium]
MTMMVGRYAYVSLDTPIDGAMAAFFFAAIAIGGIGGPAVAVHLFRTTHGWARLWGVVAGLVAVAALAVNLSNSLGAIAGRSDKTIAQRQQTADARKDDRAELARLTREREAMPALAPMDAAAVHAAKRTADAATRAREAECDNGDPKQRGRNCRAYEATESDANAKLAAVTAAKAATDQAASLESKAAVVRARLGKAEPVANVNPLADTLGRIFSLSADTAATAQQIAMVVVVELLIAFALIAWELLAPKLAPGTDEKLHANAAVILDAAPPSAAALPSPEASSVARFMLACLPRAQGERVTRGAVYKRYLRWCDQQEPRTEPLPIPAFWEQFEPLCQRVHIRMREKGGKVYCIDVRLAA